MQLWVSRVCLKLTMNYQIIKLAILFILLTLTSAVSASKNNQASKYSEEKIGITDKASERINIDSTVKAKENFYRYVNKDWLQNFQMPDHEVNYTVYTKLTDEANTHIEEIIRSSISSKEKLTEDEQKIGNFYRSFMNEERIESLGFSPLSDEFKKIDDIKNIETLSEYIGHAQIISQSPFVAYVWPDSKQVDAYILNIRQSGLGLPNRDYYLNKDSKILDEYLKHVSKVFSLTGIPEAREQASHVIKLETLLAQNQRSNEALQDPIKNNNKVSIEQATEIMPNFNWSRWARANNLNTDFSTTISIGQPEYMAQLNSLIKSEPLEVWKAYFKWHLVNSYISVLSQSLREEKKSFNNHLFGATEQTPRSKQAVTMLNDSLGQLVGRVYVANHFKPASKAKIDKVVENLLKAYRISLNDNTWMSDQTKKHAISKLDKLSVKIGYPDQWQDFSSLHIDRDDLFGNLKRIIRFKRFQNLAKLGQPVDKTEWFINPQTVNAYYNPALNEVVFPAALLRPPFFDVNQKDAFNYSAIGAIIGHEIGHAFDLGGSQFDGDGQLKNWWTENDRQEFERRTSKLVQHYNGFTLLDGLRVNGRFTLDENIADLSGLLMAHKAFKLKSQDKGSDMKHNDDIDDQLFFIGWARAWAAKTRDKTMRLRIDVDPHAPEEFRVNGTLQNIEAFYKAFNISKGDQMYLAPDKRTHIWPQ